MSYQIAVPSYKRYEILKTQTLPTLDKLKADRDKIHIFVANEEEAEKYKEAIGDNYRIVVGQRGISTQRKYIHNYFADDERVVSFDDDVIEMYEKGEKKIQPITYTLDEIVERGYEITEKHGARLWGVNPNSNNFFLKDELSVGLRYITATIMGSYGKEWIFTDPERRMTNTGEDAHSSLRAFVKYGAVVRFEYICFKTNWFAEGGNRTCVQEDGQTREQRHLEELTWVQSRFADLCKLQVHKDTGISSLRFKPITIAREPR